MSRSLSHAAIRKGVILSAEPFSLVINLALESSGRRTESVTYLKQTFRLRVHLQPQLHLFAGAVTGKRGKAAVLQNNSSQRDTRWVLDINYMDSNDLTSAWELLYSLRSVYVLKRIKM